MGTPAGAIIAYSASRIEHFGQSALVCEPEHPRQHRAQCEKPPSPELVLAPLSTRGRHTTLRVRRALPHSEGGGGNLRSSASAGSVRGLIQQRTASGPSLRTRRSAPGGADGGPARQEALARFIPNWRSNNLGVGLASRIEVSQLARLHPGPLGRCPTAEECLAYALAEPLLQGIWAGTTTAERRVLRKRPAA